MTAGTRTGRGGNPLDYDPWKLFSSVTPLEDDYVRANHDYRCGRQALWQAPCADGPSFSGACRGTAECSPHLKNGRYECRRPTRAGGPCDDGPLSEGACSQTHPPCAPTLAMPARLRRITRLAAIAMVALIAAALTFEVETSNLPNSLNPGQLSGSHAGFTADKGCVACHEGHGSSVAGWLLAAFEPNDISEGCVSCHEFAGKNDTAHNAVFPRAQETGANFTCTSCHTEHKGFNANIAEFSDGQCSNCHEKKISNFAQDHPPFSEGYPHHNRVGIKFDHSSHISKHFTDERVSDKAPSSCSGCHLVDEADQRVELVGFEAGCGACHGGQMASRELVLMRIPEFEENFFDEEEVMDSCGPTIEQFELFQEQLNVYADGEEPGIEEDEEYEAVGEDVNEFIAYLMGVDGDDAEDYGEPISTLIGEMTTDGLDPLIDRVGELDEGDHAQALLGGLNPELLKRVACAWAANIEYEPPADPVSGGWYGEYTEIRYRPLGHGDTTIKSWIEFAIASGATAEEEALDAAIEFRDTMLDRKSGPGLCIKCHVVSASKIDGEETSGEELDLEVAWNYSAEDDRPWSKYNHGPHLDILGKDLGCRNCHVIDKEADFSASLDGYDPHPYTSNFAGITRETCAQCHAPRQVRQDCLLCHEYHLEPGFKEQMLAHDETF